MSQLINNLKNQCFNVNLLQNVEMVNSKKDGKIIG